MFQIQQALRFSFSFALGLQLFSCSSPQQPQELPDLQEGMKLQATEPEARARPADPCLIKALGFERGGTWQGILIEPGTDMQGLELRNLELAEGGGLAYVKQGQDYQLFLLDAEARVQGSIKLDPPQAKTETLTGCSSNCGSDGEIFAYINLADNTVIRAWKVSLREAKLWEIDPKEVSCQESLDMLE